MVGVEYYIAAHAHTQWLTFCPPLLSESWMRQAKGHAPSPPAAAAMKAEASCAVHWTLELATTYQLLPVFVLCREHHYRFRNFAGKLGGKYEFFSCSFVARACGMARDLSCSEVLAGPGQLLDLQPALPSSMETSTSAHSRTSPTSTGAAVSVAAAAEESSQLKGQGGQEGATGGGGGRSDSSRKPVLHVEVCQHAQSSMGDSRVRELVVELLARKGTAFGQLIMDEFEDSVLQQHIVSISITDAPTQLKVWTLPPPLGPIPTFSLQLLDFRCFPLSVHVYRLYDAGPLLEELEGEEEDCASNNWTLPASELHSSISTTHWLLCCTHTEEFHGLWNSLVFDTGIKQNVSCSMQ